MKKLISTMMLLMFSIVVHAQHDVTKFLGIPIDGSKKEMIRKLKAKGFQSTLMSEVLTGEFNGVTVFVSVVTNNDKVCRIAVWDANSVDEGSILIRFNKLCEQFANCPKYLSLENFTIPEDENISYEIRIKNKRYEAAFYKNRTRLLSRNKCDPNILKNN